MANLKVKYAGISFPDMNTRPDIIDIITEALHQTANYYIQHTGPDAARIIRDSITPGDVWTDAHTYSRKHPDADGITAILTGASYAFRTEGKRHRPDSIDRMNDDTDSGTYADTIPDPGTRTENAEIMVDLQRMIPAPVMDGLKAGNQLFTACRIAGLSTAEYQRIRRKIAEYKAE